MNSKPPKIPFEIVACTFLTIFLEIAVDMLGIDWLIMMTIRPSRFITMNTVTAFEQALHLMLQWNPTAPRPGGQSSEISIFWALDGKLLGAGMHALDSADVSRISREVTREWPGVSDGSELPFFYSVNLSSVVLISAIFNPNCFQQPIRELFVKSCVLSVFNTLVTWAW